MLFLCPPFFFILRTEIRHVLERGVLRVLVSPGFFSAPFRRGATLFFDQAPIAVRLSFLRRAMSGAVNFPFDRIGCHRSLCSHFFVSEVIRGWGVGYESLSGFDQRSPGRAGWPVREEPFHYFRRFYTLG